MCFAFSVENSGGARDLELLYFILPVSLGHRYHTQTTWFL